MRAPYNLRKWLLAIASIFVLGAEIDVSAREWSDTSGKFRTQAEFVAARNGKVILEKADGSIITIPLEKLSAADQAYVRSQTGDKPAPVATRPEPVRSGAGLPEAAHAVLRTNCYRCHGQEGASEGGFNFVLNLEKLARTHVKPKEPAASLLFERMVTADDSVMPPPDEQPRPSAADIATIKSWIEAGAPATAAAKPRDFVTNDQVIKHILADIQQATERSRRFLRYFTLTHLYNAGVSEDELQTYRNAFIKLINSLSWNTDLLVPQTIDPAQTIWRVDIRQLNWSSEVWEQVEEANPYFLNLTTRDALACYEETQAKMPLVRIDWFVFAASKPPLYHVILGIPATDKELEQTLKVNVEANIDQEQVIRAAFNRSGVSQNNRLIERHKSPYGSYWKSYDFGGNIDRQNLFEHPLGPGGDDDSFKHDGGELIFTLPNGLQGYMLADSQGQRIDKGPTEIVSDPKRPDKAVTNGVSCMSCHYTGMIPKSDEIGSFVRANPKAFDNADDILALYREPKELDVVLDEDAKRFAAAMEKIGITSLSRSGEPVSTMAARFEQELDLQMVACEFGLPPVEFKKRLQASDAMARSFGALLVSSGTIKRDVFAALFGNAAMEFGLTKEPQARLAASSRSRPSIRPRANDDGKPGEVRRFNDLGWGVQSLAFSPNGNLLAAGKSDRALLLFDVNDGARLGNVDDLRNLGQVKACQFTPDGSKLLAGGYSGQILIWNVSKEGLMKPAGQFVGHSKELNCIAISSDSRFAVSGGRDNVLRYWQIDNGKELGSFPGFKGAIKACYLSSNGRNALATDGATLQLIDLKKGQVVKQSPLTRSWSAGHAAAFSPDGRFVAAGDSYSIRLWELKTGKELPKLEDNEIQWTAAFTPDSTRLISGGSGKVNVWDVRKQRKIHSLSTAGSGYVQCLATSPDNKHVAAIPSSAGQDLQVLRIPGAER